MYGDTMMKYPQERMTYQCMYMKNIPFFGKWLVHREYVW